MRKTTVAPTEPEQVVEQAEPKDLEERVRAFVERGEGRLTTTPSFNVDLPEVESDALGAGDSPVSRLQKIARSFYFMDGQGSSVGWVLSRSQLLGLITARKPVHFKGWMYYVYASLSGRDDMVVVWESNRQTFARQSDWASCQPM